MKSYVQVGWKWIIQKEHLWGLDYAHLKKSTVLGSTFLYMHEEQSHGLYQKPTNYHKTVQGFFHEQSCWTASCWSNIWDLWDAKLTTVDASQRGEILSASLQKKIRGRERVRSLCRHVIHAACTQVTTSKETLRPSCWMLIKMVVWFPWFSTFIVMERFCKHWKNTFQTHVGKPAPF